MADLNNEAARMLAASVGPRTAAVEVDVSDFQGVQRMVKETLENFGKATILVHAAAPSNRRGPALEMDPEAWARVISVILTGGFLVARTFAEQVVRQGGGGRIVNIVSTVVENPRLDSSAYCSAKTGLVALTRVLAMEFARHGITVNAVGPGLIRTSAVSERESPSYTQAFVKQVPLGRMGEPRDITNAALLALPRPTGMWCWSMPLRSTSTR